MTDGPDSHEPIWPVDLGPCRLWPMEGEDGPLLQELFDDLSDFESVFGARGDADAVSTFIALPPGIGYESKLLLGCWRDGALIGSLDCLTDYPERMTWSGGLLVFAERYRRQGIGTAVLTWLESTARSRGAEQLRWAIRASNLLGLTFARHSGYNIEQPAEPAEKPKDEAVVRVVKRL